MDITKLSLNQKNILALFDQEQYLTVGKIAKRLNIPHPTAKQSLNRLFQFNLVEKHGIKKGTFYSRKDENVILDTFGNKVVTVYSGKEAFTEFFNQLAKNLTEKDFYWSFAFKNEYYDAEMRQFFINFHAMLASKKIEDKTIVHEKVKNEVLKTYQTVPELKIEFSALELPTGMSITKDMVANLIWGEEPIIIATFSSQVIKRYQDFFQSVWKKQGKKVK